MINRDVGLLFTTRAVRAFVDGIAFVVFPVFLEALGYSGLQIGAIVTAGLFGSALLTLAVGMASHRFAPVTLLTVGSVVMCVTGVMFGFVSAFWTLVALGVVTTMNTSSGDVSAFLPLEQSLLASTVTEDDRTTVFARFNLVASLVGSAGAVSAGIPAAVAVAFGATEQAGRHGAFVVYGIAGLVVLPMYRGLSGAARMRVADRRSALGPTSRRTVLRLSALFSLDSLGGGFATQAIFALWVLRRFGLSTSSLGAVFAATGVLAAFSSLLSARIARRIGLVRTMVFTHIPASVLLVLVALSPNMWVAMTLFVLRGLLSQMDVPVRTSYVMAVVEPHERAAAASITNIPRSLASAFPPVLAGWMLDHSTFGWPLLLCAACKIVYDLLLLAMFRNVRPPEERAVA